MEVLGSDEVLAEQFTAHDLAVDLDERPVRIVVEGNLSDRRDDERVHDAEENAEHDDGQHGWTKLADEGLHVS